MRPFYGTLSSPHELLVHVSTYHHPYIHVYRCTGCTERFAAFSALTDHFRDEQQRIPVTSPKCALMHHTDPPSSLFYQAVPILNLNYLPPIIRESMEIVRFAGKHTVAVGPFTFSRLVLQDQCLNTVTTMNEIKAPLALRGPTRHHRTRHDVFYEESFPKRTDVSWPQFDNPPEDVPESPQPKTARSARSKLPPSDSESDWDPEMDQLDPIPNDPVPMGGPTTSHVR